jgi:hypothetical protein
MGVLLCKGLFLQIWEGDASKLVWATRADRILHRAGKAPLIVISAGNLPWPPAVAPESQLIADLLVELGVPRSAMILESGSRNT